LTLSQADELVGIGRYRRFGQGPPVVILSSPLASPDGWTGPYVEALVADGYEALTFMHTGTDHRYQAVVRDVVRFLDALDLEPARLFGWSQGAAIAQEVALAAPQRVAAAALVATYGRQNRFDIVLQEAWAELDRSESPADNARLAMLFLTGEPPHHLADDDYLSERVAAMRSWATLPRDPENRHRARGFIDSYQDRLLALGNIRVPCLVLGFELDADTFVKRAREVADAIPNCRYIEIPSAGHLLPLIEPSLLARLVIDFYSEADPVGLKHVDGSEVVESDELRGKARVAADPDNR
jgi:pimeloyl-ACP methyl ester carboxylesterase